MIRVRIVAFLIAFPLCLPVLAQRVGEPIVLPPSIQSGDLEWVDFDNNGLLDIMLLSKDLSGKAFLNIIKSTASGRGMTVDKSFPIIPYQAYVVADYNRDNKIDLLVSGTTTTAVYINHGNLQFEEKMLSLPPFSIARFADLDNNAISELITSGESNSGFYLRILKQQSEFNWKIVHDSIMMKCSSMETLDADRDGDIDLFTSGQLEDDSVMSGFLMNEGQFYFKPQNVISLQGKTSTGDLNNDGCFEIVLMGNDKNGMPFGKKYQRNANSLVVEDLQVKFKDATLFIADFDFDGTADIRYEGIDSFSNMSSEIWFGNNQVADLYYYYGSKFGDFDHDGRLDAIDLNLSDNANILYLLKNADPRTNLIPDAPKNAVALPVFNRLFMYWQKPEDDHTPQVSLTYDVFLQGNVPQQVGEFDLANGKRLTVSHGNNGTNNFKLFKNVGSENLKYSIQAIDNSFHAGSSCVGAGRSNCLTEHEAISVCFKDEIKFEAPPDALWFSFAKGYLGKGDNFSFVSDRTDTVFYFSPSPTGCSSIKTWSIQLNNPEIIVQTDHYKIIKGSEVQLQVEGAERYVWTPDNGLNRTDVANPIASPLSTMQYTVTGYNAAGCSSSATITVTVEDTSFVPTLFSPNEDGQNDQLKIYGLNAAQDFTFSIYNRDGSLVYKTSDVSEAVQRGWDGTKNGTEQPTGVYFWKVRGESSTGKILLNGKDSGSVVLIR